MTLFTVENTMEDMRKIPQLQDIAPYLLYSRDPDTAAFEAMPIAGVKNIGWSPEGMVKGINFLIRQFENGAKMYRVYTAEECKDDPQKEHVNVVRLIPEMVDADKPYIVLAAGGGYNAVCSATEAYPTAVTFVQRGYQVFVLTYRVGEKGILPKPLEDVAAALRLISRHSEEFSLDPDHYAIGGFSAGGNLISMWGTENTGYKAYGLPRPAALFPVYPVVDIKALESCEEERGFIKIMLGEDYTQEALEKYNVAQHIGESYPPCYIVCGKDDTTVSCKNSELLKQRLDALGIPAVLEEGEHAQHGFGDGTGTDVEGWPERAVDFLEKYA